MNMFDLAIKMELEGKEYYHKLAEQSSNEGIRNILNWMADEETKHANIFRDMQQNVDSFLQKTTIVDDAKKIFEGMAKSAEISKENSSQIDLYKHAQQLEKQSEEFYLQKAKEVDSEIQKNLFLEIADEERRHYLLLESLVEFVGRPEEWLENAEFNHLDEY